MFPNSYWANLSQLERAKCLHIIANDIEKKSLKVFNLAGKTTIREAMAIIADLSSPSVGGKTSYLAMSRESSRGSRPKEISQWVRKIITKH